MNKNKQLIIDFLSSNFYSNPTVLNKYLSPEAQIEWNGTTGLRELSGLEFSNLVSEMGKSFEVLEFNLHNCISEGNRVAISFSYDVKTVESDEVFPLAEFSCFWEIKDDLIIKGEMMSHRSNRE